MQMRDGEDIPQKGYINDNPGYLVEPERIYYSTKDMNTQSRENLNKSFPTQETDREDRGRDDNADDRMFQQDEKDDSLEMSKSNHEEYSPDQGAIESIPVEKEN